MASLPITDEVRGTIEPFAASAVSAAGEGTNATSGALPPAAAASTAAAMLLDLPSVVDLDAGLGAERSVRSLEVLLLDTRPLGPYGERATDVR